MDLDEQRQQICKFLNFSVPDETVPFSTHEVAAEDGYNRIRISYRGQDGERISAFLLLPKEGKRFTAVLIHHQHHGQRHLGKSEVCGLVGDPLQAFGSALAQRGIAVLAPDSICFEDRRRNVTGTDPDEMDVTQHYDEMCTRLLQGDTLMRKVLDDSARGISLLQEHPLIDSRRIGMLGHSYGGNTVLFHAPLDGRIRFACSSGAACSYEYKLSHQIGIEMAEVIPGFSTHFDIPDLVKCIAPRRLLVASATEDKYSMDAEAIVHSAQETYAALEAEANLEHIRFEGGHPLTQERFDYIVDWLVACAA